MKLSSLLAGASIALSVVCCAVPAAATVIVFNLPGGKAYLGNVYSMGGFTFTNTVNATESYGNWIAAGYPSYNANGATADLVQNYAGSSNIITSNNSKPFSFQSIGLADVFNQSDGGQIRFIFYYASGGFSIQTVTLNPNVLGLQIFHFSKTGLSEVVFTAETTKGPWIQFDDIGVNGAGAAGAPEPEAWTMMLVGLGGAGLSMRRARRRPTTGIGA